MEWLILIVVVPLLLVPLVLVFGFAGCGLNVVGTAPLPVATNLTAKAVFVGNENKIILTWIGSAGAAGYQLLRGEEGDTLEPIPVNITLTMFTDSLATGLSKEGTTFVYQVKAITFGGTPGSGSNLAKATTLPAAPKLEDALPFTTSHIKLNWLRKSTNGKLFRIERRKLPATGGFQYRNETVELKFEDGVETGSTYEYQVFDIVKNGYDESIPKLEVLSPPSNVVQGKPLAFHIAFGAEPPEPDWHNWCLVQRITVTGTGSQIRMTIAGSGSGLTLDRIYISQVGAGGNPWDAAADLKLIAQGVILPPGDLARVLGPIPYAISAPAPLDLLVACDINPAVGQGNIRYLDTLGAEYYFLDYAQNSGLPSQAGVQNRVPTFQTGLGRHYLVEKIEVL